MSYFWGNYCCGPSSWCPHPGWIVVADILSTPPNPYVPGELYLISETPDPGSSFFGHAGEYARYSQESGNWEFCQATLNDKVTVAGSDEGCGYWCNSVGGWVYVNPAANTYTGTNLAGTGPGIFNVFNGLVGNDFQFLGMEAGTGIALSIVDNKIRITNTILGGGGGGEINTGSNLATGPTIHGWFQGKTGVVLNFRAIEQGNNILLTNTGSTIRVEAIIPPIPAQITSTNIGVGTVPIYKGLNGTVDEFYGFKVTSEDTNVFNMLLDVPNNEIDVNWTPSNGFLSMFGDTQSLYSLGAPPNPPTFDNVPEDSGIYWFTGTGWVATPRFWVTMGTGENIHDVAQPAAASINWVKGLLAGDRMNVATVGSDIVFTADDMNNIGSNEGGGDAEVYIGMSGNTLQLRTISGIGGINVAENGDVIEVSNDGVVTLANVGTGVGFYDDVTGIVGGLAQFRTLTSPDGSVAVALNGAEVELTVPNWSTLLTNDPLGAGGNLVKAGGPPWVLRTVDGANGVQVTQNANELLVEGNYTHLNLGGGGVGVLAGTAAGVISANSLVAGAGISIGVAGGLITITNVGGTGLGASCVSAHYKLTNDVVLANQGYVNDFFVVDMGTANLSDPDVVYYAGTGEYEFQSSGRRMIQAQVTMLPGAGQDRTKVKVQFKPSGGSWADLDTLSYGYTPNNAVDQQSVITLPFPVDGNAGDRFRVLAGTEGSSVNGWIDSDATRLTVWSCNFAGGGGGSSSFLTLSDTPGSYAGEGRKVLRVNAGETAVEFWTPTFLSLNDTQASFTANRYVQVNGGGTALQNGAFAGTWATLTDTAASVGQDGQWVNTVGSTLTPKWLPQTFLASAMLPGDFTATTEAYSTIDHDVLQATDDMVDNTFYVTMPMPRGWENNTEPTIKIMYESTGTTLNFSIRTAATEATGNLNTLSWSSAITGSDSPTGTGDLDVWSITDAVNMGSNEGDWIIIEVTILSTSTFTEVNILALTIQ